MPGPTQNNFNDGWNGLSYAQMTIVKTWGNIIDISTPCSIFDDSANRGLRSRETASMNERERCCFPLESFYFYSIYAL